MSRRPGAPEPWQQLAALLRLGLDHFWRQALPSDEALLVPLREEAAELLGQPTPPELRGHYQALEKQWPPAGQSALARLVRDLELSLQETLLLTLAGEVERSHLVTLVVAQLQAPSSSPRPLVHLCSALLASLPGEDRFQPLALPQSPLLDKGLLRLSGEGPLPLQALGLSSSGWLVLLDQARSWPGCSLLADRKPQLLPETVTAELPNLVRLLASNAASGLVLRGHPRSGRRLLAAELAHQLGLAAMAVPEKLWLQEPALALACRYGRWLPVLEPVLGPGEFWRPDPPAMPVPQVVLLGTDGALQNPDFLELTMPVPAQAQRQRIWGKALGRGKLARECAEDALLSGLTIETLATNGRLLAERRGEQLGLRHIVQARQQLGSEKLRLLAQPEPRQVTRDGIVLPPLVASELERLIERSRQRESLWQGLGTTLQQTITSGVRALFVGDSGTGKTLAASYIATRLGAPLYRVDLSAVMNKYVGESEKNLSAVLDMAAASDVILLFDEADSLFGKRSEGKETGERFANMLTHFLLSRIENHPGIVLLTSNNRERIDPAFTRRLDLIIEFPVPGFEERLQLWRSHLGERGPGDDLYRLLASHCDFSGGQLRNVVLAAAVSAGSAPITAEHLLIGLRAEYRKLGRELPPRLAPLDPSSHRSSN